MVPVIPEILRSKVVVLAELFRKRRELQQANLALKAEKARELERLNESLRNANDELAMRNRELREEVAERARAEDRLRFLADTIPSIVWTCAPDGTITYANRNWFQYYGRPAEGEGPSDLTRLVLHPDDSEGVHDLVVASLAAGNNFEFEARHRSQDGEYCWFMPVRIDAFEQTRVGLLVGPSPPILRRRIGRLPGQPCPSTGTSPSTSSRRT